MTHDKPKFETKILPFGNDAIERAASLILEGFPVAVPTETVYGLAADATNGGAIARIYAAKGRPSFNPLIVHVRDLEQAETFGSFSEPARIAARSYWPGALTIIVPAKADSPIASIVTAGLPTIAIRCPAHPAMQALLRVCGKPLAAPSANRSGSISPTSADHVLKTLDGHIPLIIDGGPAKYGIESTIIGFDEHGIRLLRPGPIAFSEIRTLTAQAEVAPKASLEAPGQLASHYAPSKPLRLNVTDAQPHEWMIGFGKVEGHDTLSKSGDLVEAAARLFDALHKADASEKPAIAVAPIPESAIGIAINDRLRRAATPR